MASVGINQLESENMSTCEAEEGRKEEKAARYSEPPSLGLINHLH